jgi:cytoskeleton protein RodZ
MASFGENLQREREMRGVTLEEISSATKISVRFLQAIEAGEFAKLPGGIFTRSFIRAYAKYLGLDEEPVLAEYQLAAQPKPDVDLHRIIATRPVSREGSRTPVLALLVAAAMLSGGYALFHYSRRAAEGPGPPANPVRVSAGPAQAAAPAQEASKPAPTPAAGPAVTAAGSGPGTTPGGAPARDTASSLPGQTATAPVAKGLGADTGLVLQVAATERAWVAVETDGKTSLQRVLNPNEVETLKAKDSFDVTTGNAQGIVLTLNGETLKPLGRRGEVKSLHLTRDDVKNPAP